MRADGWDSGYENSFTLGIDGADWFTGGFGRDYDNTQRLWPTGTTAHTWRVTIGVWDAAKNKYNNSHYSGSQGPCAVLSAGKRLGVKQRLWNNNRGYATGSGGARVGVDKRCRLTVRVFDRTVWKSKPTRRDKRCYLKLTRAGDLGVFTHSGRRVWHSNTRRKHAVRALLTDRGDFTLRTASNKVVWRTRTHFPH